MKSLAHNSPSDLLGKITMRVLVLFAVLLTVGCNAPLIEYTDPDHSYLTENPTPTPSLTGYWVGTSSNTQENFQINPDGTGLYCSEYGVNSSAAAIKVVHKNGKTLLMNASWYYTLSNGSNANEKLLTSSLPNVTRDFHIYRVKDNDLSLNCRKQFRQH